MAGIPRTWTATSQAINNNAIVALPAMLNAGWLITHVSAKIVTATTLSGQVVIAASNGTTVLLVLEYLSGAPAAGSQDRDSFEMDLEYFCGYANGIQVRFQFNAAITTLRVTGELR